MDKLLYDEFTYEYHMVFSNVFFTVGALYDYKLSQYLNMCMVDYSYMNSKYKDFLNPKKAFNEIPDKNEGTLDLSFKYVLNVLEQRIKKDYEGEV